MARHLALGEVGIAFNICMEKRLETFFWRFYLPTADTTVDLLLPQPRIWLGQIFEATYPILWFSSARYRLMRRVSAFAVGGPGIGRLQMVYRELQWGIGLSPLYVAPRGESDLREAGVAQSDTP